MDFPNYFADAESSFNDASFILFGVPYEKTSSFRHGADKAPYEVRQASWNFERYDLRTGSNFEEILVHDYGDLDVQNLTSKEVFDTTKTFTSTIACKTENPDSDRRRPFNHPWNHRSVSKGYRSHFP